MIKRWLKDYITDNKQDIFVVFSLIVIGIIIGIGIYCFVSPEVKHIAISSVKEVFEISKSDTYIKTNVVLNGIKADIILIMILAFLTVTLFGKWIIYGIMILKGIAITIYTILLFNVFGPLLGTLVVLMLVVLVNCIYIPALIYLVLSFLEVNFNLFKTRISNLNLGNVTRIIAIIMISFMIMFSSVIVEQILSPVVLNIYTKL